VHFTKTTTRALAVSVALVASGGTVAGAAVFHLPILGFGRTAVAAADTKSVTAARPAAAVHRKVQPRTVVKTRYVEDVVHIPAPVAAYSATPPTALAATTPANVAPVSAPATAPQPLPSATIAPAPVTTTTPSSDPANYDDHADPESGPEHVTDGTAPAHESDDDASSAPAGDQ
jgi:hypothetical protein